MRILIFEIIGFLFEKTLNWYHSEKSYINISGTTNLSIGKLGHWIHNNNPKLKFLVNRL